MAQGDMDRGSKGSGPLIEIMPPFPYPSGIRDRQQKKNLVLFIGLVTFIGFLSHTTAKAKAKQSKTKAIKKKPKRICKFTIQKYRVSVTPCLELVFGRAYLQFTAQERVMCEVLCSNRDILYSAGAPPNLD